MNCFETISNAKPNDDVILIYGDDKVRNLTNIYNKKSIIGLKRLEVKP